MAYNYSRNKNYAIFSVKGLHTFIFYHCVILCFTLNKIANGKVYNTQDSVILEGETRPRLPGPSIFEYRNEVFKLPTPPPTKILVTHNKPHKDTVTSESADSAKVKRGNENETRTDSVDPVPPPNLANAPEDKPTLYFEYAGDELYVFEPSPMGAAPFLNEFIPPHRKQRKKKRPHPNHQNVRPSGNVILKMEHHHNHLHHSHPHPPPISISSSPSHNHNTNTNGNGRPRNKIRRPNVQIKVGPRPPHLLPPLFNFDSVKVEQVTSNDAVITRYENDFGDLFGPQKLTPEPEDVPYSVDLNQNPESNVSDGECISANEKEGQCLSFRLCYPVVFNSFDGQLKNHGLAKMLYQASGTCKNETLSNVPLEIPLDFYNHTVCCPGYFYFENTIPHHYGHRNKGPKSNDPLPLKPSHPDPMLPPTLLHEGRSFPFPNNEDENNYPDSEQFRLPNQNRIQLPPPILLHHHDMFDSDFFPEANDDHNNPDNNDGENYYLDDFEDFDPSYYPTSTSTPRSRYRQKNKQTSNSNSSTYDLDKGNDNEVLNNSTTFSNSTNNSINAEGAESSRSEVKVSNGANNNNNKTSNAGSKPKPKGQSSSNAKRVKTKINKSRNGNGTRSDQNQNSQKGSPAPGPGPVVISPPHLSAWNCPGRKMGMPRGHWPWLVALLNEGSHFCSGSLIDHRHILTSSSCVASLQGQDIGKMRAILGDRVLYSSIDGPHIWRKILRITRHLQYNPDSLEHDIAILEMETAVSYTPNIQPINLPSSSNTGHTDKAIVTGWSGADLGKRFFSPRPTVDSVVEFMDLDECHKRYNGFKVENNVANDTICTKPTALSCKADLGAPLMMKTGNCWHIIGILSHGLGCGMFPEIFTNIHKHLPWIQRNIRQHFPPEDTFLRNPKL